VVVTASARSLPARTGMIDADIGLEHHLRFSG